MRAIGLRDLRQAFERAGTVLPAAPPAPLPAPPAPDPADDIPPELLISLPDPPRVQWRRSEPEPGVVTGVRWDYDPWSKERLR
jgi:hypothetical protein